MDTLWVTHAQLVTPRGGVFGAVGIADGRIRAIRRAAPRSARTLNVRGAWLAPGFIDLHVWGDPQMVGRDAVRQGTTAFVSALGPEPRESLRRHAAERATARWTGGAQCLGLHLEGPFLNPSRGGALPKRSMRASTIGELVGLRQASRGRVRLITLAPELPGAAAAIRWCRRHGIIVSLGHSEADAATARRAVAAGARAVTHIFNGMPPLHHRRPSLVDTALIEPRLTAMVIADGVHVSASALRLLWQAKGPDGIALVTDSIRRAGWPVTARGGAYYTSSGVLAGSRLTMLEAVGQMVQLAGLTVPEAVRCATDVPARLLGLHRTMGSLVPGARADLAAFDEQFRLELTLVGGRIAYQRTG